MPTTTWWSFACCGCCCCGCGCDDASECRCLRVQLLPATAADGVRSPALEAVAGSPDRRLLLLLPKTESLMLLRCSLLWRRLRSCAREAHAGVRVAPSAAAALQVAA